MKRHRPNKLKLLRETITNLEPNQLAHVGGGHSQQLGCSMACIKSLLDSIWPY